MKRKNLALEAALAVVLGLCATGCGDPPAPAPVIATAPVAPDPTAAAREELMKTIHLAADKIKAKDYDWVFMTLVPPEMTARLDTPEKLDDAKKEFIKDGRDLNLLKCLQEVEPADPQFNADCTEATVAKKPGWDVTRDMHFKKAEGRWTLAN